MKLKKKIFYFNRTVRSVVDNDIEDRFGLERKLQLRCAVGSVRGMGCVHSGRAVAHGGLVGIPTCSAFALG